MSLKGVLLLIKGDWAEYANTFAFANWATVEAPCMFCEAHRDNLYTWIPRASPLGLPWKLASDEDYDSCCKACEVRVVIPSAAVHNKILLRLEYDKRPSGSHGRGLLSPVADVGFDKWRSPGTQPLA